MAICGSCNLDVDQGLLYVKCCECIKLFHLPCVKLTEAQFRKWAIVRRQAWKCSVCRGPSKANVLKSDLSSQDSAASQQDEEANSAQGSSHNSDVGENLESELEVILSEKPSMEEIGQQLKILCKVTGSLKLSIEFQSSKFDEILAKVARQDEIISSQGRVIKEQEQRINKLEAENKQLQKNEEEIEGDVIALDQYSRNRNVEIHGIQERTGENLIGLLTEMANQLHIPFVPTDVDVVHRLPAKDNKRKPIMVQFQRRTERNVWLQKRNTGLVSNNLVSGSDDRKIYVNVNLTPKRRELFWKARTVKKDLNFKTCWPNDNGDIIMRKTADSPAILIRSIHDLPR